MFDRNRVDHAPETHRVLVEVAFTDGTVMGGKLHVAPNKTTAETLNCSGGFVEFEPHGGERSFLAKSQLASVRPIGLPKAPCLGASAREGDAPDPYAVLGVRRGAEKDEIRTAYFSLAKAYHPDRFSGIELPEEVSAYLATMARRINAAYEALGITERRAAQRSEPVFTHNGR